MDMHDDASRYDYGSYAMFKKRALAQMAGKYAGLTCEQESRRLRVHLRHILLTTNGAATGHKYGKEDWIRQTNAVALSQEPDLHTWKYAAVQRERIRVHRQASACKIQRRFRCWYSNRELPSTSVMVAILKDAPRVTVAQERHIALQSESSVSSICAVLDPDEPYQVMVSVLGARDLVASSAGPMFVDALVSVLDGSKHEIGRLEIPRATCLPGQNDPIAWDEQVLRVGVDPDSIAPTALLDTCTVHVSLTSHASDSSPPQSGKRLGTLSIALDLLETPLAQEYAMTRWFPLERAVRGGPARGEVRLGVSFLMRQGRVWVPYRSPTNAPTTSSPKRPARGIAGDTTRTRRGQGRMPTAITSASKPPLSPRRAAPAAPTTPVKPKTKRLSVRPVRAEVISPPSSPSSCYSSDSNDTQDSTPMDSLRTKHAETLTTSPTHETPKSRADSQATKGKVGAFTANAKRDRERDDDGANESTTATSESSDSPKKNFLKRKPFKVVFQKLDWSTVGSKTDSNWARGGGKDGGTDASTSASVEVLRLQSNRKTSECSSTEPAAERSAGSALDRVSSVVADVHAACRVSAHSAALSQLKFRAERRQYLRYFEAPSIADAPTTTPPVPSEAGIQSTTYLASEAALQALWAELHADVDGAAYVAKLEPHLL